MDTNGEGGKNPRKGKGERGKEKGERRKGNGRVKVWFSRQGLIMF